MTKDDSDMLIFTHVREDGVRVFRCKYTPGNTYQLLYKKLRESSYKCIHQNMPWDYWIFENKADEETFYECFKWFMVEDFE